MYNAVEEYTRYINRRIVFSLIKAGKYQVSLDYFLKLKKSIKEK